MARVWKPSRIDPKTGKRVKYRHWYYAFRDQYGATVKRKGFTDKKATQEIARRAELTAERRAAGLHVADDDGPRQPFQIALAAYIADMFRRDASERHRRECHRCVTAVFDGCGWKRLGELRPDAIDHWLSKLAQAGKSPRTRNGYLGLTSTFLDWCVVRRLLPENPLAALKKTPNPKGARPAPRRAFRIAEFAALIGCPAASRRHDQYLLAAATGFRRSTLRKLQRRHADLSDPARPMWRLDGAILKNKRSYVLPMTPEAAEAAGRMLACPRRGKGRRAEHLLPDAPPLQQTLNADMAAAGVAKRDAAGRALVFHSFRYFFCARMARVLPIQKVKVLMCHETLQMTADLYLQLDIDDLGAEVWNAPGLMG